MCSVFISEQTANSDTYTINWLVFITEMKSFYCAVRTGSLKSILRFVFKGLITNISPDKQAVRLSALQLDPV
jgi:hypothetical protein